MIRFGIELLPHSCSEIAAELGAESGPRDDASYSLIFAMIRFRTDPLRSFVGPRAAISIIHGNLNFPIHGPKSQTPRVCCVVQEPRSTSANMTGATRRRSQGATPTRAETLPRPSPRGHTRLSLTSPPVQFLLTIYGPTVYKDSVAFAWLQ